MKNWRVGDFNLMEKDNALLETISKKFWKGKVSSSY